MSRLNIELITHDDYVESEDDRVRTENLSANEIYTFHALIKGFAGPALKATVRLDDFDFRPRSSNLPAEAAVSILDDDFRTQETFDSRILHGLWTPDPNNLLIVRRKIFMSPAVKGYFLRYDDQVDMSELDDLIQTTLPELTPLLPGGPDREDADEHALEPTSI